jgi:hypothetical protein
LKKRTIGRKRPSTAYFFFAGFFVAVFFVAFFALAIIPLPLFERILRSSILNIAD